MVMNPISPFEAGSVEEHTNLTGQIEVDLPAAHNQGMNCGRLSVWLEGRWTDLEGDKQKGSIVCFERKGEVEVDQVQGLCLQPGTQR
jgi:hypothetical protein